MPYATQRDRRPAELEITKVPYPAPPLNVMIRSGFKPGVYDLTWDDPAILALNSSFVICGVNIYRSFDSEYGPFHRITEFPIGSTFWRDQTENELVVEEDVTDRFVLFGNAGTGIDAPRYVFTTLHHPIVKEASQEVVANSPFDVQVFVDGQQVPILRVQGAYGEVEIDVHRRPDVATQSYLPTVVPTRESKVTCTYRYTRQLVRTDLLQRVFYRVTTVGIPIETDLSTVQSQDLIETPIAEATAVSSYEVEKLDYIWKEAARRNRFILEQGGERVRVFLRKNVGLPCPCTPDDYHQQPQGDCLICFATGIIGGYEGPYDMIIAPDDSEKRITQKEIGRVVEHSYESWTGPTPILSQRDFIVKINGERYSVGAVRFPSNRGMILQQHFNVGHIDEKDIRNKVPVDCPIKYAAIQFAPTGPEEGGPEVVTDKSNIPEERQLKGRTPVWENIEY